MRHDRHKNDGSTTSSRKALLQRNCHITFAKNPHLAFVSAFAQHAHTLHSFLRLHSTQQAPRQVSTATHPARSAHHLSTQHKPFSEALIRYECQHYTPPVSLPVAKPRLNREAGVAPEAPHCATPGASGDLYVHDSSVCKSRLPRMCFSLE